MTKNMHQTKKNEKRRRSDIIFGIVLASSIGIILTLFSNLYYDLVITKNINFESINYFHVLSWVAVLLALWGFIRFFVYDFANEPEINLSFWKRFARYFFRSFGPIKFLRFVIGIYLILVLLFLSLSLLISIFITISKLFGYRIAIIMIAVLMAIEGVEYILKKANK